jgi:arginyl-tRNA synthetase
MEVSRHLDRVEIAGPGFINFHLSRHSLYANLRRVLESGEALRLRGSGVAPADPGEFVSANPNGPLHVGHGRGRGLRRLASPTSSRRTGHKVQREYYVNDAGRQMDILAVSVWLRYLELGGVNVRFPDNGYKGDYVVEIARALRAAARATGLRRNASRSYDGSADEGQGGDKEAHVDALISARARCSASRLSLVFNAGLESCLADIRPTSRSSTSTTTSFFSERSLSTTGAVQHAIDRLTEGGHMYESEGRCGSAPPLSATRRTAWSCARTAPARTSPPTSPTC